MAEIYIGTEQIGGGGGSADLTVVNASVNSLESSVNSLETSAGKFISKDGNKNVAITGNIASTNNYCITHGYGSNINGTNNWNCVNLGYSCSITGKYNTGVFIFSGNNSDVTNDTNSGCLLEGNGNDLTGKNNSGIHIEGYGNTFSANGKRSVHIEGDNNIATNSFESAHGALNISNSSEGGFGSPGNTLFSIGNGQKDSEYSGRTNSTPHNAFEVMQSGDIYIADVLGGGEYYEKPMMNLQQVLYYLDSQIGSGGGGADLTVLNASVNLIEQDYVKSNDISTFLTSDDISAFITDDDISTFVTSTQLDASYVVIDASLKAFDASIRALANNPGGGGGEGGTSPDLSGYVTYENLNTSIGQFTYSKSQIDASYATVDTSLKAFDASIRALAQNPGGGGADMSNYATKSDISTFKPVVYTDLSTYEDMVEQETLDDDTMYVITDLASSDDLATFITLDDLSTAKAQINASLNETATAVINVANTSINYWKETYVSAANSSINSIKNTAVSAVQSQQTTSVNAVNSAKTSAISDISTAAAEKVAAMPALVVMTESAYEEITPDSNTIYFLT